MPQRIRKYDYVRVVASELLPYHVPIIFSPVCSLPILRHLLSTSKSKKLPPLIQKIFATKDDTIPFLYQIPKIPKAPRRLALMHPGHYLDFVEFYKDYDSLILHLCGRSPATLRAPAKVASYYYMNRNIKYLRRNISPADGDKMQEDADMETMYASSYFAYRGYPLLHRFFGSYHFHQLEKKFRCLHRFDVSKCFDSIYTHTICWAVKDKFFAKANKNAYDEHASFENRFDKLMQRINFGETHGIIIGPEVSRIFAEILFQSIELRVIQKLKAKDLEFGKQYEIRRYVDDYFVFVNKDSDFDSILHEFKTELAEFKLHINDSKTKGIAVPFASNIDIAKLEIEKILNELRDLLYANIENSRLTKANFIADKYILKIKCCLRQNNVQYADIANYFIGIFVKVANGLLDKYAKSPSEICSSAIYTLVDIFLFVAAMAPSVRMTETLAQIAININLRLLARDEFKSSLVKKFGDEISALIRRDAYTDLYDDISVPNLLITLKNLQIKLPYKDWKQFFEHVMKTDLNYFQIIALLYYMENDSLYHNEKSNLEKKILDIFGSKFLNKKAAEAYLFFDILRCPYITARTKSTISELMSHAYGCSKKSADIKVVITFVERRNWFSTWQHGIKIYDALLKKKFNTPY